MPRPEPEILHLDEAIVAVSKPGGLLCHRSRESSDREFLLQEVRSRVGRRVYPVHRLDRAASGVLVYGLSSEDARRLQESLGSEESIREYLALVRGSTAERWECSRPLKDERGRPQSAHSSFEKIAEFSRLSLLRVRISTGRRHQIRRHLAGEAHQILGDTTYGKGRLNAFFREAYGLPRLFLHAALLQVRHPRSGELLRLSAPLASDLREFLARLPDVPSGLLERL